MKNLKAFLRGTRKPFEWGWENKAAIGVATFCGCVVWLTGMVGEPVDILFMMIAVNVGCIIFYSREIIRDMAFAVIDIKYELKRQNLLIKELIAQQASTNANLNLTAGILAGKELRNQREQ